MPLLTVWMVRAALLHMGAGFFFGALMLSNKGTPVDATLWLYLPVHIELVMVGWIVQFVMGMAFWILPRFTHGMRYGNIRLGWTAFVLINAGVVAVVLSKWFSTGGWLPFVGHTLEAAAVIAFVWQVWARIKPFGA